MSEKVRAISLWQPWASAIARGAKRIETRSWSTRYRGPLLIHAARTTVGLALARQTIMGSFLYQAFTPTEHASVRDAIDALPRGAIVAVCRLVHCIPTEDVREPPLEMAFGDYTPGRFAWLLDNVVPVQDPLPWRGSRSLFDVEPPADFARQYLLGSFPNLER